MAFAVIALSAAAQNDAVKNDHVTLKANGEFVDEWVSATDIVYVYK